MKFTVLFVARFIKIGTKFSKFLENYFVKIVKLSNLIRLSSFYEIIYFEKYLYFGHWRLIFERKIYKIPSLLQGHFPLVSFTIFQIFLLRLIKHTDANILLF